MSPHPWRRVRAKRSERGQMLIVFAMIIMPVSFAVGVVAVDASLWQSERRGAQKDADLAALAGATELLLHTTPTAGEAQTAATTSADTNDEAGNASIIGSVVVDNSCWHTSRLDSVMVNVDHDSRSFFSQIFGHDLAPEIGAHARACIGSVISGTGRIPIQIDNNGPCFTPQEQPIYTQLCALEFGSQDTNPRGVIDLEASGNNCSRAGGSGDLYNLILNGAAGFCTTDTDGVCVPANNGPWQDCVAVQTGNAKKIVDGFSDRVAREGSCDTDGSGVEEFSETVTLVVDSGNPATSLYEPRTCPNGSISPRIVTIFVLDQNPGTSSGNTGLPIVAFASFYLKGCAFDNQPVTVAQMDVECAASNKFGHVMIWGNFVRLITTGDIGEFDPSATNLGVALVE
jgi:hypothetical protein